MKTLLWLTFLGKHQTPITNIMEKLIYHAINVVPFPSAKTAMFVNTAHEPWPFFETLSFLMYTKAKYQVQTIRRFI